MRMISAAVLCGAMLAAAPAWAGNWSPLLRNTPLQSFTASDLDAMQEQGLAFLRSDGTLLEWRNPRTCAGGSFKLLRQKVLNGRLCKDMTVTLYTAQHRPASTSVRACRERPGTWKLVDVIEP